MPGCNRTTSSLSHKDSSRETGKTSESRPRRPALAVFVLAAAITIAGGLSLGGLGANADSPALFDGSIAAGHAVRQARSAFGAGAAAEAAVRAGSAVHHRAAGSAAAVPDSAAGSAAGHSGDTSGHVAAPLDAAGASGSLADEPPGPALRPGGGGRSARRRDSGSHDPRGLCSDDHHVPGSHPRVPPDPAPGGGVFGQLLPDDQP